jgi:DNA repair exonuclease SbcCD ATPase subunit
MYKIVNVFVQNVKKIKMVDITPEGNVTILEGKNAQGKTSVLDAIEYALSGKSSLPPKPIRDGAETAKVRVDIGDYIVERSWSSSGNSYLTIESKETGLNVKAPQQFLDEIIGKLSFDPFKFVNMKPEERIYEIKKIAGIDFTALENKYNIAYAQRTDLNRDLAKLKGEAASYKDLEELKPTRKIIEIQKALDAAAEHNGKISEWQRQISACVIETNNAKEIIVDLERQKKELEARIEKGLNVINQIKTKQQGIQTNIDMVSIIDTTDLKTELTTAQNQAGLKFKHERKEEIKKQISNAEKDILFKDNTIENIKAEKAEMLRAAKMPIEGLTIGKDDIYFLDQPFVQLSDAQKIRVSLSVVAANESELRFVQIRNGSLLDDTNLEEIKKFAEARDLIVWIERVANAPSGDKSAVFLEEGTIKK